jgi:hypothetical protein
MRPGSFLTVFDAGVAGFKDWYFPAFGLIFVAVGGVFIFAPRILRATGIPLVNFRSWGFTFFRFGFAGFGLLWTLMAFAGIYSAYARHQSLLHGTGCRVVEGTIDDFVPMPASGHATEHFTVGGVPFSYSDYIMTDAFNNASSLGGPVRAGQYVRVCYDPRDFAILRLDIRDFKGSVPDYAHAPAFPPPVAVPSAQGAPPLPFFSQLFVPLYFLDFLGLFLLFPPYLATFFRSKPMQTTAPIHPRLWAPALRFKLRNTLLRWDEARNVFWLRPRGFNIFLVPLMAAQLEVDPSRSAVTSYRLMLSSGFPVVLLFFFAGAFVLMFNTLPKGNWAPEIFLGVFAAVAVPMGIFRLRRTRERMRMLVEEALPELNSTG